MSMHEQRAGLEADSSRRRPPVEDEVRRQNSKFNDRHDNSCSSFDVKEDARESCT